MPHQINWIQAEDAIHAQHKQAFALAEKSVRIGWTHADSFKNVRKRLRFKERDYLFATKDYQSALEYVRQAKKFAEFFNFTKAIVAHGEDYMKVSRLDDQGKSTGFTEEIKIGFIKFDNGSCIRAFSAHPQAMAVYGGDVGLDEFAKHPNARLLWETAQGRVTWALKSFRMGFDVAASGKGDLTVFYVDEFQRPNFWLRLLFTCRTDDWHFIKTVLFALMQELPSMSVAGDETGLGRQICWEASRKFGSRFHPINFSAQKPDLGFGLMNQLSMGEKRFPRSEQDIAADYFALRKKFQGAKWIFSESTNSLNPASHCDIAWAGGLASAANNFSHGIGATLG